MYKTSNWSPSSHILPPLPALSLGAPPLSKVQAELLARPPCTEPSSSLLEYCQEWSPDPLNTAWETSPGKEWSFIHLWLIVTDGFNFQWHFYFLQVHKVENTKIKKIKLMPSNIFKCLPKLVHPTPRAWFLFIYWVCVQSSLLLSVVLMGLLIALLGRKVLARSTQHGYACILHLVWCFLP